MGEADFEQNALVKAVEGGLAEQGKEAGELKVSTPGGRFQVRWDENGSASALGQLAFFAEFLEVSGVFERWVESCPMAYTSPNAPEVVVTYWARGCYRSWMVRDAMRISRDCVATRWRRRYWG